MPSYPRQHTVWVLGYTWRTHSWTFPTTACSVSTSHLSTCYPLPWSLLLVLAPLSAGSRVARMPGLSTWLPQSGWQLSRRPYGLATPMRRHWSSSGSCWRLVLSWGLPARPALTTPTRTARPVPRGLMLLAALHGGLGAELAGSVGRTPGTPAWPGPSFAVPAGLLLVAMLKSSQSS